MIPYRIDTVKNIWLEAGEKLMVSEDPDGLRCVEIVFMVGDSKQSRITIPPAAAYVLAQAITSIAKELEEKKQYENI